MTYPRPIDVFEKAVSAALAAYRDDLCNGISDYHAEPVARDRIIKAWVRTVHGRDQELALRRARARLDHKAAAG